MKINKKSQSGFELLTNYGWTMFVVFLIITVLTLAGFFYLDRFLPNKVDISDRTIQIIHSDTNRFLLKNIGGNTLFNLRINFTSLDCIETDVYDVKPNEIIEFKILCKNTPPKNSRLRSEFTVNYDIKEYGQTMSRIANGLYFVRGNFFSSKGLTMYLNMDKIHSSENEKYIEDNSWNNNRAYIRDYGNIGVGNTGEPINNPQLTRGRTNYALNFIDRDSLEIKHSDVLNIGNNPNEEFTISLWFYSLNEEDTTNPIIIKSSPNNPASINTDFVIYNQSGFTGFGTGSNIDNCAWLQTDLNLNNGWNHIVGTLKSFDENTGRKHLYINGNLIRNCTYTQKSPKNENVIHIATSNRASFFKGYLDEIIIFKRELTFDEVLALYQSQ